MLWHEYRGEPRDGVEKRGGYGITVVVERNEATHLCVTLRLNLALLAETHCGNGL